MKPTRRRLVSATKSRHLAAILAQSATANSASANSASANSDAKPPQHPVERRRFLQAAGAASMGMLAAGAIPQTAAAKHRSENVIETEVLVCGGGCAGLGAALSAARNGAKTLLVERAGFAGGIITAVGLPYFDGIANIKDNRIVVRGIGRELLAKSGVCAADATHVKVHNPTIPGTFQFKVLTDRLLTAEKEHLSILYHSPVCGIETAGDRIREVLVANKAGLMRIRPQVIVDCTGDADLAHWAGAPTEQKDEVQPMTLHFRIGHVERRPETGKLCREALIKAQERGELPMFYGPGVQFMFAADEIYIHGVRVPGNACDPADPTRCEIQGRSDAWAMYEAWKRDVPGFENAYFIESSPFIGVRETRRIVGQHVLHEDEIVARKSFDDAIATGCWYLDMHPNKTTLGSANATPKIQPEPYDIPYRSLLPKQISNLLVAGRCHSATQLAASSTRVTVTAMAMGEAAGLAAAMSIRAKQTPQELDGSAVRKQLKVQGGGPASDWS